MQDSHLSRCCAYAYHRGRAGLRPHLVHDRGPGRSSQGPAVQRPLPLLHVALAVHERLEALLHLRPRLGTAEVTAHWQMHPRKRAFWAHCAMR